MKRISFYVIGFHISVLLWMALWMPVKKSAKKPIQVRTMIETPYKPSPKVETVSVKSPLKKKSNPVQKTVLQKPKTPLISDALKTQLQQSIAKIEEKNPKEIPPIPSQLKMEINNEESIYQTDLIHFLQNHLQLPEMGEVKLELTLRCDGSFLQMKILESASKSNQTFLETQLHTLHYPAFIGPLKKKKEHVFTITFCNH